MRALLVVHLIGSLLLAAACGPSGKKAVGPAAGRESEAVGTFPILRRVPGNSLYFAATARLDQVPTLVRDVLRPIGRIERDADPDALDGELRKELGFSFLNAADLAAAGFAVDRNFAIASTNLLPTVFVPVADAARVKERITSLTRGVSIVVSEHRGVELSVFKEPGDSEFLAWVFVDDVMIMHLGIEGYERGATEWLNEILDSKAPLSAEADLDWAHQQAGGRNDVLGLVRLPQILTLARSLDDAESRTPACDARNDAVARALGRGALAATIVAGKLDLHAFVELAAAASTALVEHTALPPEAAFLAIAGEAGFSAGFGLDLDWLGSTFKDLAERDCGAVPQIIKELDLDEAKDPLRELLGARPFAAVHAALLGGSAGLGGVDVQAVGFARVADENAARQLLGQVGAGQPASVDGVAVTRVSQPGLASPIDYTLGSGVLRVAVGRGLVARLAKGGESGGGARTLFAFAVRPDKIPDLFSALALVGGRDAEVLARFLGEYRFLGGQVAADRGGLSLTGGFELR